MDIPQVKPSKKDGLNELVAAAVGSALENNWQQAAKINEKILNLNKDDVEALNRLALAYSCMNQAPKAQKIYKKVLEIDPHNIIAKKNLDKLIRANGQSNGTNQISGDIQSIFIYEPGKTKLINLLNLAAPSTLATINCGEQLTINPKKHAITITTLAGTYLGALPDDLAHRLISFINEGYKYEAYVKSVSAKGLTAIVKEVHRSPNFTNQPTFQTNFAPEDKESVN